MGERKLLTCETEISSWGRSVSPLGVEGVGEVGLSQRTSMWLCVLDHLLFRRWHFSWFALANQFTDAASRDSTPDADSKPNEQATHGVVMSPGQDTEDNGNGCKNGHDPLPRDYPFPFSVVRHALSSFVERLLDDVPGRIITPRNNDQPKRYSTSDTG